MGERKPKKKPSRPVETLADEVQQAIDELRRAYATFGRELPEEELRMRALDALDQLQGQYLEAAVTRAIGGMMGGMPGIEPDDD